MTQKPSRAERQTKKRESEGYVPTEAEVKDQINDYLLALGCWTFRTAGSMYHGKGRVDIYWGKGRLWGGIEAKSPRYPNRWATAEQMEEMLRIQAAGGIAFCVHTLDEVMNALGDALRAEIVARVL